MKPATLAALRAPLAFFIVALIAGLIAHTQTARLRDEARLALDQARAERERDDRQLREREQNQRDAALLASKMDAITRSGVLDEPRHADWVAALRLARERLGLRAVQYEIAPAQTLAPNFQRTPMRVHFQALHEADALALADALREKPGPWLRIVSLSITRDPAAARDDGPATQLRADYQFEWLAIKPEGEKK